MSDVRWRRWEWVALVGLTLLALGLRLYRLDAQSLWNDEGTSVALAQRSFAAITRDASHDIHPPLYYYLLHLWVRMTGASEFAVRSLSALVGALVVTGSYLLARRRLGRAAAPVAAWLAALSPLQVYYAQEARMYIGVTLFGLLSMLAYDALVERLDALPRRWLWPALGYLAATCAAVYTHYFALTLLAAQGLGLMLWLAARRGREQHGQRARRALLVWAALFALVLGAYLPWLRLTWRTVLGWPGVSAPFTLGELAARLARLFPLGITGRADAASLGIGIAWLALAALALADAASVKAASVNGVPQEDGVQRWLGIWQSALYWLIPVVAMVAASLRRPMYNPKFLLLATPGFHLMAAAGVAALGRRLALARRRRWVRGACVGLLSLALGASVIPSLRGLYFDPAYARDDYRGIAATITAGARADDAVLINAPSQIETVTYYYQGPLPLYPLPLQRPLDQDETERALQEMVTRHGRIWAIYWATAESDPQGFIEGWLDARCFKASDHWYGNLRLVLYAVPRTAEGAIAQPLDVVFGDVVRLQGYTLYTPSPASGDVVQLTLYWEALRPVDRRLKVFTHVLDARGHIVGQRDSEPGGGRALTTSWPVGETVADNYGLPIAVGAPPGEHLLRIGLYGLEDGQRLPVTAGGSGLPDAVDLVTLPVQRAPVPPPVSSLDMDAGDDRAWGAIRLLGHSLYPLGRRHEADWQPRSGQVAELLLFWQREKEGPAPTTWVLALMDRAGASVWEYRFELVGGDYPPTAWERGEIVRDIHHLPLSGDLAPGAYRLELAPEGSGEADAHELGRLTLSP
jgi:4-amino-4-deoxy-L-arabinose transferase-like glycosyltransferase